MLKRKKYISGLLILVFLINYLPALEVHAISEKNTIAIYDLSSAGGNKEMAATLTDILRNVIFKTGLFDMLSKEDMTRMLSSLAERQIIEPNCNSEACIATIAEELNVDLMVAGSIVKVGDTYVINLRLFDTESARTVNATTVSCTCREDILIERLKRAGLDLLRIESDTKKSAAPTKIESAPPPVRETPLRFESNVEAAAPAPTAAPREVLRKGNNSWLWWTLGIGGVVVVVAVVAVAAGQKKTAAKKSSGSEDKSTSGDVEISW